MSNHRNRFYRKSPSRLPRINTPPEHEGYRSDLDLRRDSFERVPPLAGGDCLGFPFSYSPSDTFHLQKQKKKVRYVEEPEILQGKTPSYMSSNASSPSNFSIKDDRLYDYQSDDFLSPAISPRKKMQPRRPPEVSTLRQNSQSLKKPEHEELIFEEILRDILQEETRTATKSFVRNFAQSHLQKAAGYDIMMRLVEELLNDLGPALMDDALHEAWVDMLYEEILQSCIGSIARATILECQKDMIDKYAQETVLDGMVLDSLLAQIMKPGKPMSKEETSDLLLDDLILTNLLEQYFIRQDAESDT